MADPITAVIAAVVKIGTAVVAAYKASAIVRLAIHAAAMLASAFLSQAFASKPGKIDQGQEIVLKLDPTMPRQVAVGRVATGGSQSWGFTYGTSGDVQNRYLVRIIALSDRPIKNVVTVREGSDVLSFTSNIHSTLAACASHRGKRGEERMWLQVVRGADVDAHLNVPAWLIDASGGRWTNQHKYTGGAYAVVRYDYDPDAFPNGEPNLTFVLDGASAFDDRESVVEGGTQVLTDPSTWEFTRNAANITLQLLRGYYTNGTLIVGAQAPEHSLIPAENIAALNTCDQIVSLSGGGSVPRYVAGLMLTAAEPTSSPLQDLQNAMDGEIIDRNGKIIVLPGATRSPVYALTDDDIDWTAEKSYQPYSTLSSLYNQVSGTYVPESLGYVEASFPVQRDDSFVEQDGGQSINLGQAFRAVNGDNQIQRITVRILKASRFQKVVAFTGPLWLYVAQKGDWFALTSARWNLSTKYFEIQKITLNADLRVTIIALETSSSIDGWDPAEEAPRDDGFYVPPEYEVGTPTITATPITVATYNAEDEVEETIPPSTDPLPPIDEVDWEDFPEVGAETLTKVPGIALELEVPKGSPSMAFEVQYRQALNPNNIKNLPMIAKGGTYNEYLELPEDYVDGVTYTRVSQAIMPNTVYQFRARSYDGARYSAWSNWTSVTTFGAYSVPDAGGIGGYTYPAIFTWLAKTAQEARDALTQVSEIGEILNEETLAQIQELVDALPGFVNIPDNLTEYAQSIIELTQRAQTVEEWIRGFAFPEDLPVGSVVIREIQERIDGDEITLEAVDALSVVVDDSAAYFANEIDLVADGLSAEVAARQALGVVVGNNAAYFASEIDLVADGLSAEIVARQGLAVVVNDNRAYLENEVSLVATDLSAEIVTRQALGVVVADNAAYFESEISLVATDLTAEINARQALGIVVDDNQAYLVSEISGVASDLGAEISARTALGVIVGNNYTYFESEITAVATDLSTEISARTALAGVVGANYAYFEEEISLVVTGLDAEIVARQALGVTVGNNQSYLIGQITLVADDLSAEATRTDNLIVRVEDAEGAISTEQTVRANQDGVFITNFNLLGGRRGDHSGWILSDTSVDITGEGSLASILSGLYATDGTLSGQITALSEVSEDHATQINALEVSSADFSNSITELFEISGDLVLRAALALNNDGVITGYEIDGIEQSFIIAAQYFGISATSGGTAYYPLAVTGSGVQVATRLYIGGTNFYLDPATQTMVSVFGGQRTMFGGPFGSSADLAIWSGPTSVSLGSELLDNGTLGISATDGWFGGKVLNGPFDTGLQSGAFSLSTDWQNVAEVSAKALRPGRMSLWVTLQTSGTGTVVSSEPGITVYGLSCDWRVITTNVSGGDLEVINSGTYARTQVNNSAFANAYGGRSPTGFNDRSDTTKHGIRKIILQAKRGTFGSALAVDQRQLNGDFYTTG